MFDQRLPEVGADDGTWGDILRQYLMKEHVNDDTDNPLNGGHKTITVVAGTTSAGTAPIKLTSGSLMTSPEAGAIEFLNDTLYFTQTTGPTRMQIVTTAGTQTLTNKTLTAPQIQSIHDAVEDIEIARFQSLDGSFSNMYLEFFARQTFSDNAPIIRSAGPGANIGIMLEPKGSGSVHIYGSTGETPTLEAKGDDSNHDLNLVSKGTGVVQANGLEVVTVSDTQTLTNKSLTNPNINEIWEAGNSVPVLEMNGDNTSNRYMRVGNSNGAAPYFEAVGTGSDIGIAISPKGAGAVEIWSTTGNTPTVAAYGDDTDLHLDLVGKGTGVVRADNDGTPREVATISGEQTLTNKTILVPIVTTPIAGAHGHGTDSIPVPAGVAADDIVVVFYQPFPSSAVVTPPAGFTEMPNSPAVGNSAGSTFAMHVYWKRATGADSGTYDFSDTGGYRSGMAIRIENCPTSGDPFDVDEDADTATSTANPPDISLTTTIDNTLLVWVAIANDDPTMTVPSGFTSIYHGTHDNSVEIAVRQQETAGSTGTLSSTGSATNEYAAWIGAFKQEPRSLHDVLLENSSNSVQTLSNKTLHEPVVTGNGVELVDSGSQYRAYNNDSDRVKFATWYDDDEDQYGIGQNYFESWMGAINSDPGRRIAFYLDQPNDVGTRPTNERMSIEDDGVKIPTGTLTVGGQDVITENNIPQEGIVASTNLLTTNPTFDSDISGWTQVNGSWSWASGEGHSSNGAASITMTAGSKDLQSTTVSVVYGNTYAVSVWVKGTSMPGGNSHMTLEVREYDGATPVRYTEIQGGMYSSGHNYWNRVWSPTGTVEWTQLHGTFTVSDPDVDGVALNLWCDGMTSGTIYFDDAFVGVPSINPSFIKGLGPALDSIRWVGQTFENKRIVPRVDETVSSATPAINVDGVETFKITALATNITSMTSGLTGTPTDRQKLLISIKDDGTPRTITWGASFQASGTVTPLATTVANMTHHVGFIWDDTIDKWVCLACDDVGY